MLKVFDIEYISDLQNKAQNSQRKRKHSNIHESYQEPCQRLFNAIEFGSYIRPHRHFGDTSEELLIAVRGVMALFTFDDFGNVLHTVVFSSHKHGNENAVGLQISGKIWHTVVALEQRCLVLEVKRGPFDPNNAKEFAP